MEMKLLEKEKLANGLVIQLLTTVETETEGKDARQKAKELFILSSYAIAKNDYHSSLGYKRLADEILVNILPIVYHFDMKDIEEEMKNMEREAERLAEINAQRNKETTENS
jgi:hypothetical protein